MSITCCPNAYYSPQLDVTTAIHGDEFIAEGMTEALDVLEELLRIWIGIKILGRIGPGATGAQQGKILKRNIEWRQHPSPRFVWYVDCRHVTNILKVIGLPEDSKPMLSPGTKATGGTLDITKEWGADEKNTVPNAGGN